MIPQCVTCAHLRGQNCQRPHRLTGLPLNVSAIEEREATGAGRCGASAGWYRAINPISHLAVVDSLERIEHALSTAQEALRGIHAPHNYCFNSNDDRRCGVDGWSDCRAARSAVMESANAIQSAVDAMHRATLSVSSDLATQGAQR